MTEESLFGNVSLMGDFIDVPGKGEVPIPQEPVEKPTEEKETPKTPEKPKEGEEDFTFEIPDFVKPVEKPQETTEIEKPEDKSKDTQVSKGNSSSSPFKPFAKALFDEGVLTSFDEEEFDKLVEELGSPAEVLIELNRRTLADEIESYKKEAEDDYKAFLEARESGVNIDEWGNIRDMKKRYSSITDTQIDEDEKLQKDLIRADLENKGNDEETIREMLESFEDTNKLSKQAKTALKNLTKFADEEDKRLTKEAKERDEELVKQQKKQLTDLKKQIEDTKEVIPGMPLNKQVKDKLFNLITAPVKQTEDGRQINAVMAKRMEDPLKYALLEAYFVELGLFDGKFDKLVAKAKTKAITELESSLSSGSNTDFKSSSKGGFSKSEEEEVSEFESAFKRIK